MTAPDLPALLGFARRLADRAGEVVRPLFRAGLEADAKPDGSPVTRADRAVEQAMREMVVASFPDHGIHGEEYGQERRDADLVWVFDPIDGTKAFLVGKPTFTTLIALLHRGRPVLGVIDQPVTGDRWAGATTLATTLGDAAVRTRACASLAEARFSSTGPQYFRADERRSVEAILSRVGLVSWGGDGYQYGLVASGSLDLVIEAGLALHDWAAIEPVIANAGGVVTDWNGRPLGSEPGGHVVAAGDPRVHAEALALLGAS